MEMVKKHMISILCVAAIIALALPFAKVTSTAEVFGQTAEASSSFSGFQTLSHSVFAYIMIAGPAILIVMNYIKQLEPFKGILAIVVPVVCLIALIIVMLTAKSFSMAVDGGMVDAEVKVTPGIGAIVAGVLYVGTAVAGAVTFHNFTFDKAGLERLKNSATDMISSVQEKKLEGHEPSAAGAEPAKAAPKKAMSLNRIDEILCLIEKLAKMKDAGVLTEEEFSDKKKQLLGEIQ